MRKMSKLMSLLMVLVMVLMLVPASAFAADKTVVEEPVIVVQTVTDKAAADVVTTTVAEPVATTPAVTTPAVTTPAATEPAVTTPAVTTPAVTTPAATTPAVTTPVATTPADAVTMQAAEAPAVTTPIVVQEIEVKQVPLLQLWRNDAVDPINVLIESVGADYAYDAIANALTLNNFVGEWLRAEDMGSAFAIILKGDNVIKHDDFCAVDVVGDLTISGTGELVAEGMYNGIHVMDGDLVINSGSVEAAAFADNDEATGIYVENGDLTINGGYVDAMAINTGTTANDDAYGLWADGDLVVNGGDVDVFTYSAAGQSMGIGAGDDAVFNGGYTTVWSDTETGVATALFAESWVVIDNGILDLCATGGINPLAIYGGEGVYIDPCYGYVDLTASCLYLEPNCCDHHKHMKSTNPKTGTQDMSQDALIAIMALLALMGTAYLVSKKESQF